MFCIHLLKGSEQEIFQSLTKNKYGIEQLLVIPCLTRGHTSKERIDHFLILQNRKSLCNIVFNFLKPTQTDKLAIRSLNQYVQFTATDDQLKEKLICDAACLSRFSGCSMTLGIALTYLKIQKNNSLLSNGVAQSILVVNFKLSYLQ